ncbi:hypothetical protein PoB_002630000 [Plakobranchus ocellatus]|uniref:G-protein coupled receptors family 1 profile domain-containing protein n=1 Tax=Plakobranchus ocellatus TaxID=259542 RepID=A0AAV3ZX75_9GAST|nr:hypothetical protein PoB_002630000 [Plakobranchus ocellatus]
MNETIGLHFLFISLTGIINDNLDVYLRGTLSLLILTFSLPSIIINIINRLHLHQHQSDRQHHRLFSRTCCRRFVLHAALDGYDFWLLLRRYRGVMEFGSGHCQLCPRWNLRFDIGYFLGYYNLHRSTTWIMRGPAFVARTLFTKNKSIKGITATLIFLVLCHLPRMLLFRVVKSRHQEKTRVLF